ncbi:hypothetical protein SAM23877_5990 [Streptomyces ambofaciens ATCC 23877]|uniref:Uncharacterized protein n=1 Tax=Streptomyces ambofaciens (strain ATCC 23877 / 3486 / DSM 40053 / JCM 4204 / NBRC 12836 / NRRL B-2516) TaxID=278992 RepID=A0A0K2B105_STRA7|nr:hypothetical protein SAM23877_5990 [Streptomyces ambofaciens ATCC 23877]
MTVRRHGREIEGTVNDAESTAEAMIFDLVDSIARRSPPGWLEMSAEFALAGSAQSIDITLHYPDTTLRVQPSPVEVELIRKQRGVTATTDAGPWWRMSLVVTAEGEADVTYDYGESPFPEDQLFPPEAYRADLAEHPRRDLPLWMNAYVNHGDRQSRSPRRAAREVRENRARSRWPQLTVNEFPAFPEMWARWAVMSAAFVAAGSEWGPRVAPGFAWFEGAARGGSTLYRLPGDRAVLSGGVWNAPSLAAGYATGRLPDLFRGAPEWVADPVLNPRGRRGLMTFCYWWEGGCWYRGDSPTASACANAVPGVWTDRTVADVIGRLADADGSEDIGQAAEELVSSGHQGTVTREALVRLLGDADAQDVDDALFQLSVAGVQYSLPPDELPEGTALSLARKHVEPPAGSAKGPSADAFEAERLGTGWRLYVPAPGSTTPVGQVAYVDDDGDGLAVPSSGAGSAAQVIAAFERRFRSRHSPGDVPPPGP